MRNWSKQWTLSDLGMEPGDELYFFVRASDNAEPPAPLCSRRPTPCACPVWWRSDDETSALPILVKPENLRSQRQIIIDTEQLVADMKAQPDESGRHARAQRDDCP